MRTTVEIDDEIFKALKHKAYNSRTSLKKIINRCLSRALENENTGKVAAPYQCPVFAMGKTVNNSINVDKALRLADLMEEEEVVHKLELRK